MKPYLHFKKFSFTQKIVAGYAAMAFFTMTALAFALMGLYSLHNTASDMAKNDFYFIRATGILRESLIAQERYAGKYAILKSPEFKELYKKRETEFLETLALMERQGDRKQTEALIANYRRFMSAAEIMFDKKSGDQQPIRIAAERAAQSIESIYNERQRLLAEKLKEADRKERSTIRWTIFLSFTGFLLAVCVAVLVTRNISKAVNKLKKGTMRIAEGDFDFDPQIPEGDEIGDLAREFTRMAKRLKVLEQISLDASPLTRLPGNIAIERVLNGKLECAEPFAACYADLDNFKAYNDRYGYIKASEVIKATGDIINHAVNRHGEPDAFVGHIGGDDFVMVIDPAHVTAICEAVIEEFSQMIVEHYSEEDVQKGAIEGMDRYGVPRVFPIMTISIAVLICKRDEFASAAEIAGALAEIKDQVKEKPGSNYFINWRKKSK